MLSQPSLIFPTILVFCGLPARDGEGVELLNVVTYPAMKKPDGSVSRGFTYGTKAPVKDGATCRVPSWSFDHPYELVPGVWQFEVRYGGKTLVQQAFAVAKE